MGSPWNGKHIELPLQAYLQGVQHDLWLNKKLRIYFTKSYRPENRPRWWESLGGHPDGKLSGDPRSQPSPPLLENPFPALPLQFTWSMRQRFL